MGLFYLGRDAGGDFAGLKHSPAISLDHLPHHLADNRGLEPSLVEGIKRLGDSPRKRAGGDIRLARAAVRGVRQNRRHAALSRYLLSRFPPATERRDTPYSVSISHDTNRNTRARERRMLTARGAYRRVIS